MLQDFLFPTHWMLFCSLTAYASSKKFLFWERHRLCRVRGTVPEMDVSRSEFTEIDIPVGVGWSQKPQVGSRCSITLLSWWWVWKALLPAWLQQEHHHSESNCLSQTRMHQERLIPDGWWGLKFLFIKKKPQQTQPNETTPLSLSASPLAAFYFAVSQDPTPCTLWWKMS